MVASSKNTEFYSAISITQKLERELNLAVIGPSLGQNGGMASLQRLIVKYAPDQIRVLHITSHDEGSILYRTSIFIQACFVVLWRLVGRRIDLAHLHMSDGGCLYRNAIFILIIAAFSKPIVLHTHGAEFDVRFARLHPWLQFLFAKILRRCDAFIVLANSWKDYYLSTLGLDEKKVFLLRNPCELPEEVPVRASSEKVRFVFCGRVGQRKGAFDLIYAFSQLPTSFREQAELFLAGDGEIEQAKHLIEQLGLTKHIHVLGWISPSERDRLLQKADVFVLPSYHEGLPLALMEAMGWGLPPITTSIAGIPEIVNSQQNGILIEPGAIEDLSGAMQVMIEDEALRVSLGKAARATVSAFGIKPFYQQLLCIYELSMSVKHPNHLGKHE